MNTATPKKREWPVIRVFVSSTFTDIKYERNALHQNVSRKLELHCRARGFQFQAIDLRWGVPMEAALDHRTMQICFEELGRCQQISPQPNFLILLGNRYGWRPLPEVISAEEFARGFEVWFDRMAMPSAWANVSPGNSGRGRRARAVGAGRRANSRCVGLRAAGMAVCAPG